MCVIVDACVAPAIFGLPKNEDSATLLDWLQGPGRLVLGGRNRDELLLMKRQVVSYVQELQRGRRVRQIADAEIAPIERHLKAEAGYSSDDPHVLALGIASGARTLCTSDDKLIADWKDARVISNPRGAIYKTRAHRHLLVHTPSCRVGG